MTSHSNNSESDTLTKYALSLENVKNQPIIAEEMAACGYDTVKIKEGEELLADCTQDVEAQEKESGEATQASSSFHEAEADLGTLYRQHRKRAKVVFMNDAVTLQILGLMGVVPNAYAKWVDAMRIFYRGLKNNPEMLAKLARFKITITDVDAALALITDLETKYAAYKKEEGEAEDSTSVKDLAYQKIHDWMSEFYATAQIALEDHPQLLEALGIVVRR